MKDGTVLKTGVIGSVIAAICCFTPILVVLAAGVGLSAVVGWLDYALFPALFTFLGVTAYALYLRAGRVGPPPKGVIVAAVVFLVRWPVRSDGRSPGSRADSLLILQERFARSEIDKDEAEGRRAVLRQA